MSSLLAPRGRLDRRTCGLTEPAGRPVFRNRYGSPRGVYMKQACADKASRGEHGPAIPSAGPGTMLSASRRSRPCAPRPAQAPRPGRRPLGKAWVKATTEHGCVSLVRHRPLGRPAADETSFCLDPQAFHELA